MLNQIVLVGRLTKDLELKKGENGTKYASMTLAIPRAFKNAEGEYETDFIECKLWNTIAKNTCEYCKKGDIVGVKGRIQTESVDGAYKINVIAERVTFLSSKPKEEDE